jgi:hypothetical protein
MLALPQRDERYLDHVRSLPCSVSRCHNTADPHHAKLDWQPVSEGGMSRKGSDFCAVPLCRIHHGEIHSRGVLWFEAQYGLQIDRLIVATLIGYIAVLTGTSRRRTR